MIVGCGPWIFESWEKGKQLSFRRNEAYYAPKPYLLRRIIKIIKEPTARLEALRNGEIDRMGLLPEQWVNQTGDEAFNAKFAKFQYPARVFNYIGYNMRRDLFKDRRVRLALTHLVDRERILKDVYFGLGRIVTGPFYIDSPSYDHEHQTLALRRGQGQGAAGRSRLEGHHRQRRPPQGREEVRVHVHDRLRQPDRPSRSPRSCATTSPRPASS